MTREIKIGDYCFASRWSDEDPHDPWAVGPSMNKEEFQKLYFGTWEPCAKSEALHQKLQEYYDATPDSVSNKVVMSLYKEFLNWAKECGFTQEEILTVRIRTLKFRYRE